MFYVVRAGPAFRYNWYPHGFFYHEGYEGTKGSLSKCSIIFEARFQMNRIDRMTK